MELHREEKREEGDRGDQEEKMGGQKERGKSSQQSIPYLLSTVWNTQRGTQSYTEKRKGEEGDRGDLGEINESQRGKSNQTSNLTCR